MNQTAASYILQIRGKCNHVRKVIAFLTLLSTYLTVTGQSIQILTGQTISRSKEITSNPNFHNEFTNNPPLLLLKMNSLYRLKGFDIGYSLQYHEIWTRIKVDDWPTNFFGYGTSNITVFRNSLVLGYDIFKKSDRLSISPAVYLSVDRFTNRGFRKEEGVKFPYRTIILFETAGTINQDFEGIIYEEVFDGWAFLPGIGVQAEWNFLLRFILSCNVDYSFGTREYQNFYFDHSYKGGPRQETKFTADGSLFSASVGIGFKLWNHKKSRKPE